MKTTQHKYYYFKIELFEVKINQMKLICKNTFKNTLNLIK